MEAELVPIGLGNADTTLFMIQSGSTLEGKLRIFATRVLKDAYIELALRGFVETRRSSGETPKAGSFVDEKAGTLSCYTKKFLEQTLVLRDYKKADGSSPHIPVSQFGPLQIPFSFHVPNDGNKKIHRSHSSSILF